MPEQRAFYLKGGAAVTDDRYRIFDIPSASNRYGQRDPMGGNASGSASNTASPNWSFGFEYVTVHGHARRQLTTVVVARSAARTVFARMSTCSPHASTINRRASGRRATNSRARRDPTSQAPAGPGLFSMESFDYGRAAARKRAIGGRRILMQSSRSPASGSGQFDCGKRCSPVCPWNVINKGCR